LATEPQW